MRRRRAGRRLLVFPQASRNGRVKKQFRATGDLSLADLDQDVAGEIERLRARMNERVEGLLAFQPTSIPWLWEEDTLLQLLRLQGFGFAQISRVSLILTNFYAFHRGFQLLQAFLPSPIDVLYPYTCTRSYIITYVPRTHLYPSKFLTLSIRHLSLSIVSQPLHLHVTLDPNRNRDTQRSKAQHTYRRNKYP